jgi:hypothetical protein
VRAQDAPFRLAQRVAGVEQRATDVQLADVVEEPRLTEHDGFVAGEPRGDGDARAQQPDVEHVAVRFVIVL